jgi:hypothetical protein
MTCDEFRIEREVFVDHARGREMGLDDLAAGTSIEARCFG